MKFSTIFSLFPQYLFHTLCIIANGELNLFYENKFTNLNKLLKNNISDFAKLSKNFISFEEHNKIINDIKKTYNDLLENTKNNYEKLINELTDIMK